jgi:hypothetical protein
MKFIANGTKYEFDDEKVTFAEARAIEKVTGRTMAEVSRAGAEDVTTMQAMIWVAMKREDATLRFSDLDDMPIGDIEWVPDEPVESDGEGEQSDPPALEVAAVEESSPPSE